VEYNGLVGPAGIEPATLGLEIRGAQLVIRCLQLHAYIKPGRFLSPPEAGDPYAPHLQRRLPVSSAAAR